RQRERSTTRADPPLSGIRPSQIRRQSAARPAPRPRTVRIAARMATAIMNLLQTRVKFGRAARFHACNTVFYLSDAFGGGRGAAGFPAGYKPLISGTDSQSVPCQPS